MLQLGLCEVWSNKNHSLLCVAIRYTAVSPAAFSRIYTQLNLNPEPLLLDHSTARCVLKYATCNMLLMASVLFGHLKCITFQVCPSLATAGFLLPHLSYGHLKKSVMSLRQRHKSKNFCRTSPVRFHGNNAFTPWRWEGFWMFLSGFREYSKYSNHRFHVSGGHDSPNGNRKCLCACTCCCNTPLTSGLSRKLKRSF